MGGTEPAFDPDKVVILHPPQVGLFDAGRPLHRVDDDILGRAGPYIRLVMLEEAGERNEAVIVRACGKGAWLPASEWQREVPREHREWLRDLCVEANERASYTGFWAFAWKDANQPNEWVGLWFDADGDFQTSLEEVGRPFPRMRAFGIGNYVANCDLAIRTWAEQVAKLELHERQVVSPQGQPLPK